MASLHEYLEHRLGYGPRAARDRMRVAFALEQMPELTDGLEAGELPFTAIRELTRVATPATEPAWREAATGKNVRQIEELVAGHERGDHPEDPKKPELRLQTVSLELRPEIVARLRQFQRSLGEESEVAVDDSLVMSTLLDGAIAPKDRPQNCTTPGAARNFRAGSITFTNTSEPVTLNPASDGIYPAHTSSRPLFDAGVELAIHASGDEVPALDATVVAPAMPTIMSPDLTAPVTIDRAADLTVAWSPVSADAISVEISQGIDSLTGVSCRLPAAPGTGVVPATALSILGARSAQISFESVERLHVPSMAGLSRSAPHFRRSRATVHRRRRPST